MSKTVKLEKVLGLTVSSKASFSCDRNSGVIAYPAGSTVVLFNGADSRQTHLIGTTRKPISCLDFSKNGRYVATGEVGHEPVVRVWDVETKAIVVELKGHKNGINCVAFSPNGKYLVSVGNQHDSVVNVWQWQQSIRVASNKVTCDVRAVAFNESGECFVTTGMRHVKFWYMHRSKPSAASAKIHDSVLPLQGRSGILSDHRNNHFVDVVCGRGDTVDKTYCITQNGLLCEFNNRRIIERWLNFQTSFASSIVYGDGYLFLGCSNGSVRVFVAASLQISHLIHRPHYLGFDVAIATGPEHLVNHPPNAIYPNTLAMCYDEQRHWLSCVYADHSLYQWDVQDFQHIGKVSSNLYHSGCIWSMEVCPESSQTQLSAGSFITASADETVRIWHCAEVTDGTLQTQRRCFGDNVYSNELKKVLFLGIDVSSLDVTSTDDRGVALDGENGCCSGAARNGVRAIRLSPDGRHLASGDRNGNVRVHNLEDMRLIGEWEAHDGDVLCLEFSDPSADPYLLASASRDRLIHVYDANNDYQPVATIDDHPSAILALLFVPPSIDDGVRRALRMLSCGADKTVVFRQFGERNGVAGFARTNFVLLPMTGYDMKLSPGRSTLYVGCQDRQIRSYNVDTAKMKQSVKGCISDDGNISKIDMDPSGHLAVTSCSDKTVSLVVARTGDCVGAINGHRVTLNRDFDRAFERAVSVYERTTVTAEPIEELLHRHLAVKIFVLLERQDEKARKSKENCVICLVSVDSPARNKMRACPAFDKCKAQYHIECIKEWLAEKVAMPTASGDELIRCPCCQKPWPGLQYNNNNTNGKPLSSKSK